MTLAIVAAILYWASRLRGWARCRDEQGPRRGGVLARGGEDRGHPAQVRCDTKGEYVGFVEEADGLAFVGGRRAPT